MFLLRRCSCQTKSLLSYANHIPFIRIRKGCVIRSFSVDRLSLTHATWCKSNMNSYDECVWTATPSRRPRPCLLFPVRPFTRPMRPGNRQASLAFSPTPPEPLLPPNPPPNPTPPPPPPPKTP